MGVPYQVFTCPGGTINNAALTPLAQAGGPYTTGFGQVTFTSTFHPNTQMVGTVEIAVAGPNTDVGGINYNYFSGPTGTVTKISGPLTLPGGMASTTAGQTLELRIVSAAFDAYSNVQFSLGNPLIPVSAAPVERLIQIAPNLFFETPVYPPLDLQPEAGPIEYPDYELGPSYFQNAFYPFGRLGPDGSDPKNAGLRVKTRKKMACLRRKGHIYLAIGPSAVPAATQINLAGTAEWLKFTPGLANLAAAAGNQNLGIRVYKGTSNFPVGKWITGYNPITVFPDWVGNATFADLFPWEGPMTFFIEITSTAAIPAASSFEFCFDGLDLG